MDKNKSRVVLLQRVLDLGSNMSGQATAYDSNKWIQMIPHPIIHAFSFNIVGSTSIVNDEGDEEYIRQIVTS